MANVATAPKALAVKLLAILDKDSDKLEKLDRYVRGEQDDPYMPANSDTEYRLLATRSITNVMTLLVGAPAQALYVDDFRPGNRPLAASSPAIGTATGTATGTVTATVAGQAGKSFEMQHWQQSRMDARQSAIYRGAFTFGHAFTLTAKTKGGVRTTGLSAMKTAALYEDPANDETPYVALTVTKKPTEKELGRARMFDATYEYEVTFKSYTDKDSVRVVSRRRHGASECPITRFAAHVDLDGRTIGVVEPMIPLQNRINQTVFDLLVAQTYGSFKVRWVTGMAPPVERDPDTGDPVLDEHGSPQPVPMNHNARRFLFAEDQDTRFGSLDETALGGFIDSIDMSFRHLAAISQTPPHHLLGQIANLSAEALLAAETAFARMITEFRNAFGEAWERVFRLAAEMDDSPEAQIAAQDFAGEVLWRDMEQRSLAQAADALGKLREQLGIPARGLWSRVPGVTSGELETWREMAEDENLDLAISQALTRATPEIPPDSGPTDTLSPVAA